MFTGKMRLVTPKRYYLEVSKCPLDVWEKCSERMYANLRITKKGNIESDYEAWNILFKDFVKNIGLDPTFEKYIDNLHRLINLQHKFVTSRIKKQGAIVRDRKILNLIKMLKAEIANFEKTGDDEGISINQMLKKLGRMQRYEIRKNITVLDYFNLIKEYREWQASK